MFQSLKQKINKFIGKTEGIAEREITKGETTERKTPEREIKLTKTTKIKGVFKRSIKLSESDLEGMLYDLQLDLIQNDVAMETTEAICAELKEKLTGREIEKGNLDEFVKNSFRETLLDTLTPKKQEEDVDLLSLIQQSEKPYKMVFFGVNGTGKTTTIAKVAKYLTGNNLTVVLAAGDTFRAGAIEQIEKHAGIQNIKLIKHQKGGDAAAVIYDAIEHARAHRIDVVLADTAGRMQSNVNLMDEMKKICRVNNPDLRIFVGDSLTGNDAVDQAEKFNSEIGIDAIILTKMDADARGGAALSIANITGKPILFVGVGQGYGDLKRFERDWFVGQILGS